MEIGHKTFRGKKGKNVTLEFFILFVTGHFSVKVDLTQFKKYRSLYYRQVKHIGVEHLLFFRIRNELQLVKARKGIS